MVFFKVIGFIIIGQGIPLALMWGIGGFVGQRKPSVFIANVIKILISASLFLVHAAGTLYAYKYYQNHWWNLPLSAVICGVGITAIVAVNSYGDGKTDEAIEVSPDA